MSYYIDDDYISERFFEGETVPGDKTISSGRNTSLKRRATQKINGLLETTTNVTDTYSDLEEIAGNLYEMGLEGEKMMLSPDDEALIVDRYGNVPFAINDPTQYELNENE